MGLGPEQGLESYVFLCYVLYTRHSDSNRGREPLFSAVPVPFPVPVPVPVPVPSSLYEPKHRLITFSPCSTEHELGHIFAVTTALNNGTFNEDICISSGFMLAEVVCSQGIIIIVTALSGRE